MDALAKLDDHIENFGPDVAAQIEETLDQKVEQAVDLLIAFLVFRSSEVLD